MLTRLLKRTMATAISTNPYSAPLLVSPSELKHLLYSNTSPSTTTSSEPRKTVKFLDATWFMPNVNRNALKEFQTKRIPNANFWDLDAIASPNDLGLKHMLPDGPQFRQACQRFGISKNDHVVIYDTHGVFSSPRALFTFRAFGHKLSSILNGGLPCWEANGLPIDSSPAKDDENLPPHNTYPDLTGDGSVIKSYEDMVVNSKLDPQTHKDAAFVLDARSAGRWKGSDPEPRPGLSSGHIPYSFSVPFNILLQQNVNETTSTTYTTMRTPAELKNVFVEQLGKDRLDEILAGKRSVINTCGSGMTAAIIWLALQMLDTKSAIYDESWTGYAGRAGSVIIKNA